MLGESRTCSSSYFNNGPTFPQQLSAPQRATFIHGTNERQSGVLFPLKKMWALCLELLLKIPNQFNLYNPKIFAII